MPKYTYTCQNDHCCAEVESKKWLGPSIICQQELQSHVCQNGCSFIVARLYRKCIFCNAAIISRESVTCGEDMITYDDPPNQEDSQPGDDNPSDDDGPEKPTVFDTNDIEGLFDWN